MELDLIWIHGNTDTLAAFVLLTLHWLNKETIQLPEPGTCLAY